MSRDVNNAYNGSKPFAFVSYAHHDGIKVYPIIDALIDDGYRIWYDEGIEPIQEWLGVINKHIEDCSIFVVFVSKYAMKRPRVIKECSYAIAKHKRLHIVLLEAMEDSDIDINLRADFITSQYTIAYGRHSSVIYNDICVPLSNFRSNKATMPATREPLVYDNASNTDVDNKKGHEKTDILRVASIVGKSKPNGLRNKSSLKYVLVTLCFSRHRSRISMTACAGAIILDLPFLVGVKRHCREPSFKGAS